MSGPLAQCGGMLCVDDILLRVLFSMKNWFVRKQMI